MCRLLLAKSEKEISPEEILARFANAVKNSPAPDGDWQGDGWGIAWLDENNSWQVKKSLKPIWEDIDIFSGIPKTKAFVIHARSATYPNQKGILEFNEPFIHGEYAFVFNGFLKGVKLSNVPGRIGAERIWNILIEQLKSNSPELALERTKQVLLKNSKEIIALNIGLASKKDIYSLNYFTKYSEYYKLFKSHLDNIITICSERI